MKIILGILTAAPLVAAHTSTGYRGYGLVGYGIDMSKPTCAYACHDAMSEYQLDCSTVLDPNDPNAHHHGRRRKFVTSEECYATNKNYLRSIAYCISTYCPADISISTLENYWAAFLIGRHPGQPAPNETFSVSLYNANPPPSKVVESKALLNTTTLVDMETYMANYLSNFVFEENEIKQSDFGLILLITGGALPIACSLLRFIPFPRGLTSRFNAYIIDPPLFGRRHQEPFHNLALVPTRGQALLITYFIVINIVLSCVGYQLVPDSPYYQLRADEVLTYIANREGVLAFANVALLVLYAGRNNILLYLTNWSYSTFILLHRWVAIICTLEACIHALIYVHGYRVENDYDEESKETYWIYGIVAILSMCVLLPTSILPLRQKIYNLFVTFHVVLALVALVACYHHIFYRFENQWGYETWIYIAFGFWGFDRLLRFGRLARNGVRKAYMTIVDENYIRVDIPGVVAQGHAYLYFPTLSWRVWENHPFSVMGAMIAQEPQKLPGLTMSDDSNSPIDLEKATGRVSTNGSFGSDTPTPTYKPGLTFFITTRGNGLTAKLHAKSRLPVLVEASYGASELEELRAVPNCIVIAGGVGITALASVLRTRGTGRVRLFWGVRSNALVEAVRASLGPDVLAPSIVGEIAIGRRLDLRGILYREAINDAETAVVVCGPVGMADEVREIVCELGRKGRAVRLVDEAFSW
ncbi:ferric reductase like transmembrane component-domain-containing protein [Hypomontagnella monticulosa]|nr:ferric reductase like transmembrane component-domain-containing protein [Hypomontagnella monticulosa]